MSAEDAMGRMVAQFQEAGRQLVAELQRRFAAIPRGDLSGWYYIDAAGSDLADGRHTATIKAKNEAVSSTNPAIGPLPCIHSYTPAPGHRVLVTWVAGDRADGVIIG